MILAVWAPLLMPLPAVLAARLLARRLAPRTAAWLLACCAAGLAVPATTALALLTGAGFLHLPFVAALGDLSPSLLRRASHGAVPLACAAGPALAASVGFAARTALRRLAELSRARRAVRTRAAGLTVVPEDFPDAYAVPGRPGRVVVTTGLLGVLTRHEREVVYAHERAHLAGRHHWFVVAADIAAALHPALAALREPLRYNLERWADESAAVAVGDRRLVARAIGRAALARARAGRRPAAPAITPSATAGPVPRRVAALLAGPPRQTRPGLLPGVATALAACILASGAGTLDAVTDLHGRIEAVEAHHGAHLLPSRARVIRMRDA